jgi:endo-1,4-beta-xylanase
MPDLAHRRTHATIRLIDASGAPRAGARVAIEQVRRSFAFGNIGFDFIEPIGGPAPFAPVPEAAANRPDPALLAERYLELFDAVTLPFYWRQFEPEPGRTDAARLGATAEWFQARGVRVKGHPLLWHTLAPAWLLPLDDAAVEDAVRARIRSVAGAFAGRVDQWDAINEAVILPVFAAEDNAITRLARRKGRVEMVRMAFEEARAADPDARLVLNDFDLSPAYERLIEECLDAGVAIDAIGLQTHMHQGYRGEEQVRAILDRFARFGLPLQLTETTLVSGELMPVHIVDLNDHVVDSWPTTPEGEERQADEIVRHYRTVFAHPATESLTYWGLTDAGAWLGAPAGLLRADGSPKPSFTALADLIRGEWSTPAATVVADGDGIVRVDGFAGLHRLSVDGVVVDTDLPAGETAAVIREEPTP